MTSQRDPFSLRARQLALAPRRLGFEASGRDPHWPDRLRARARDLLCLPHVEGAPRWRWDGDATLHPAGRARRFAIEPEPGVELVVTLLRPTTADGPLPVMICLQGHTPGAHISLGQAANSSERALVRGGRDFAVQAVGHGYAAIALEMRGFGECAEQRPPVQRNAATAPGDNATCKHLAMSALLCGRTLLGERVFDLMRLCDVIGEMPGLDATRISAMGNSGGGTVIWWTSALEPRLRSVIIGSAFATTAGSIGSIDHCCDNYVPGQLDWFDFADLAGAMRGTRVLAVMGRRDHLFPLPEVRAAHAQVRRIFAAAGRPGDVALVLGAGGHRFYPDLAWPAFARLTEAHGVAGRARRKCF